MTDYAGTKMGPNGHRYNVADGGVPEDVAAPEPAWPVRVYGEPTDGATITVVNGRPTWTTA